MAKPSPADMGVIVNGVALFTHIILWFFHHTSFMCANGCNEHAADYSLWSTYTLMMMIVFIINMGLRALAVMDKDVNQYMRGSMAAIALAYLLFVIGALRWNTAAGCADDMAGCDDLKDDPKYIADTMNGAMLWFMLGSLLWLGAAIVVQVKLIPEQGINALTSAFNWFTFFSVCFFIRSYGMYLTYGNVVDDKNKPEDQPREAWTEYTFAEGHIAACVGMGLLLYDALNAKKAAGGGGSPAARAES